MLYCRSTASRPQYCFSRLACRELTTHGGLAHPPSTFIACAQPARIHLYGRVGYEHPPFPCVVGACAVASAVLFGIQHSQKPPLALSSDMSFVCFALLAVRGSRDFLIRLHCLVHSMYRRRNTAVVLENRASFIFFVRCSWPMEDAILLYRTPEGQPTSTMYDEGARWF